MAQTQYRIQGRGMQEGAVRRTCGTGCKGAWC